jgi:hypothetical protein
MPTIRLINDNELTEADFVNVTAAVAHFVPLITKAWGLPTYQVVGGGVAQAGDWVVNITEKNRLAGANGYHEDINGIPVAYCSLRGAGRIYGTYLKPFTFQGKLVHPAIYSEGIVTVICHEIAEMLCDPQVVNYSKPDAQGREWLIEVCDHVFGSYSFYVVDGQVAVLPDVTTPAFYEVGSKAPYSIFGGATAPFTMTKSGYGYYKDSHGVLQRL